VKAASGYQAASHRIFTANATGKINEPAELMLANAALAFEIGLASDDSFGSILGARRGKRWQKLLPFAASCAFMAERAIVLVEQARSSTPICGAAGFGWYDLGPAID